MTRIRQSALVAVTLMALVAAAGCSGAAGQGGDDTALQADRASGAAPEGRGPGAPGAPGAPGPGGPDENARAPGSPITIPAFTQIGGQPVEKGPPGDRGRHPAGLHASSRPVRDDAG
jgi:hypothetical protein